MFCQHVGVTSDVVLRRLDTLVERFLDGDLPLSAFVGAFTKTHDPGSVARRWAFAEARAFSLAADHLLAEFLRTEHPDRIDPERDAIVRSQVRGVWGMRVRDNRRRRGEEPDAEELCLVCGWDLGEAGWSAAGPEYVICDCCGSESGVDDCGYATMRAVRVGWARQGYLWSNPPSMPPDWSRDVARAQLWRIGADVDAVELSASRRDRGRSRTAQVRTR